MKLIFWLTLAAVLALTAGKTTFAAETNHNFARWEKEISAFEQSDTTNAPLKGALLFIGSSTIRGWKTLANDLTLARPAPSTKTRR